MARALMWILVATGAGWAGLSLVKGGLGLLGLLILCLAFAALLLALRDLLLALWRGEWKRMAATIKAEVKADRRTGVILLLLGVGIPLVLFPFAQGYYYPAGLWGSLRNMDIYLWQTKAPVCRNELVSTGTFTRWGPAVEYERRCTSPEYFTLPYRYPFALGVVCFVAGLAILILPRIRDKGGEAT